MATATGNKHHRYLELVAAFPLRPIHKDSEHRRAIKVLDALLDRPKLSRDERDYLEVLADIIEKYEESHLEIVPIPDREMLSFLMEAAGVTQAEVARCTGIPNSVLSNIAHGKRDLNRGQIAKLSGYFHVSPAVFDFADG